MKLWLILLAALSLVLTASCMAMDQPPDDKGRESDDRPPRRDRPRREDRGPGRTAQRTPATSGVVKEFHQNPNGDTDGLLLDDGTEVRFPPSAGKKVTGAVALKERVTIEGWKHPGESEIHAATIKHEASGKSLSVDRPPPEIAQRGQGDRRGKPDPVNEDDDRPPPPPDGDRDDERGLKPKPKEDRPPQGDRRGKPQPGEEDENDDRSPPPPDGDSEDEAGFKPKPKEDRPPRDDRRGKPEDEDDDRPPPPRDKEAGREPGPKPKPKGQRPLKGDPKRQYSLEQAVSDHAQLHTIAFDGLAFLTGDFGYDTFLPPGKVSDYFGFQYMRDIDAKEGGHNTSFLTRIAYNMLAVLTDEQKAQLVALGKQQEKDIQRFAEMRFPLIKAFRRNLEGDLPAGRKGLDKKAVMKYSADLYELDGRLAYERAKVMGGILHGLTAGQKAALAKLKFGDSRTWPEVQETLDRRSMSHTVHVAVMTYASEMFAWQGGSVEADVYFCPERHGMYFGGFGMKTAPAMGKKDYSISTSLTGDSGENFLAALSADQRGRITDLVDLQREDLNEIVKTRQAISTELRRFQKGEVADKDKVLALSRRYGELDGELSYLYATAFAKVGKTLTAAQKRKLAAMRTSNPSDPKGPFLYSAPVKTLNVPNTDFLFGRP